MNQLVLIVFTSHQMEAFIIELLHHKTSQMIVVHVNQKAEYYALLFDCFEMFNKMPIALINTTMLVEPAEKNGSGTPVD